MEVVVIMKLLYIDLETTPCVAMVWGLFKQTISVDQILTPTSVLCFAAKFAGEPMQFHKSVKQEGPQFEKMIKAAHKLLCEADAVVHFNGISFDVPRLNTEFIKLGLPPPPTIPQIDLKNVVMSKFAMTSSKLAFVGPFLKIGEKVKNDGWPLWQGCLAGNKESWAKMETYNRQDVVLLEKLYNKVLPWIDNHPNMNLFIDSEHPLCPNCGSNKVQRRGQQLGTTYTYTRYSCNSCGRWSRSRTRDQKGRTAPLR